MRTWFKMTLALGVAALTAGSALAQPGPGGPGGGGPLGLLNNPQVKKELNLTDEQLAKLLKATQGLPTARKITEDEIAAEIAAYRTGRA